MAQNETPLSNEALVLRFQNGEDRLFTLLVERMAPMLRQEVARIRCNRSDGDDLAQEALLALLAAAKSFCADERASFATYARVCVRNRLLSAVRALSLPELPHEEDKLFDELERKAGTAFDPGMQLLDQEKDLALIEKLKSLLSTLEYRVLMFHLAAYSYEGIAAALGVSVKAVDNALQRIRRKLAVLL